MGCFLPSHSSEKEVAEVFSQSLQRKKKKIKAHRTCCGCCQPSNFYFSLFVFGNLVKCVYLWCVCTLLCESWNEPFFYIIEFYSLSGCAISIRSGCNVNIQAPIIHEKFNILFLLVCFPPDARPSM